MKVWFNGESFTYTDWNRFVNTAIEIADKFAITRPTLSLATVNDYPTVTKINTLITWLINALHSIYGDMIPDEWCDLKTVSVNDSVWVADDVNAIECDLDVLLNTRTMEVTVLLESDDILTAENNDTIITEILTNEV